MKIFKPLRELKQEAEKIASFRDHSIHWYLEKPGLAFGICPECGKGVHCLTNPPLNGIEVAGEAIAVNCTKELTGMELITCLVEEYETKQYVYQRNMWRDSGDWDIINAASQRPLSRLRGAVMAEENPEEILTIPFGWRAIVRVDDVGLFRNSDNHLFIRKVAVWGELPAITLQDCTFFIIYTVYCPQDDSLPRYYPRHAYRKWNITETEGEDYEWYADKKYRKLVGEVSYEDFMYMVDELGLKYEGETMGSLTERGLLPALSFGNSDFFMDDVAVNAYVTPIPKMEAPDSERQQVLVWEKLSQLLKEID
jgi:hypothetical protein